MKVSAKIIKRHFKEHSRYSFFGPCHFSAGIVHKPVEAGFPACDEIYLEYGKPSEGTHRLLLMPQEAQAIIASLAHSLFKLSARKTWKKVLKKRMGKPLYETGNAGNVADAKARLGLGETSKSSVPDAARVSVDKLSQEAKTKNDLH